MLHGGALSAAARSNGPSPAIPILFNFNGLGGVAGSYWNLLYKLQKRYHSPAPLVFWLA